MSRVNIPKTLEHHHFLLLGKSMNFRWPFSMSFFVCLPEGMSRWFVGHSTIQNFTLFLPANGGDGTGLKKTYIYIFLVGGHLPLWDSMKFPTEWKNKIHVPIPNHQPDFFSVARWEIFHFMKFINACEIYIHARRWRSFPQSISWINSETYPGLCCWKCSSTVDEVCQKGKIHEMSPVHSCKRKQTQFQETSKWGPCSSWISDMQFSSFCSSWVSRIHLNQTILMVVAETSILNQNHCWLRHTGWTHPWKKRRFDSFNTSPGTHLRRWISQFCWSIFLCSATHFGGLNNHILLSIWVLELSNRATAHTHCHLRRVHERIPEIRLGVLGLRIPFGNLT